MDETAGAFQKLTTKDSPSKQHKDVEKIREKHSKLINEDATYKKTIQHIETMMTPAADSGAAQGGNANFLASAANRKVGDRSNQHFDELDPAVQISSDELQQLEDAINREGDLLFRNASDSSSGVALGFSEFYAMDWSHVGMYSGDSEIFDSSNEECSNGQDGVALRELEEFYNDADDVMYAQLANQSWRWSQEGAMEDSQNAYGTNCQTPFTMNVFTISGTSSFFCSKLVWRTYLDNENYSVDVNSNHFDYFWWLYQKYGFMGAWYIITFTVAPDEIALDTDLDNYYEASIN